MSAERRYAHDLKTPVRLRLFVHINRTWPAHLAAGILTMPLAIEAGVPLAGTLGYIHALTAILSAPRTLWPRILPQGGPARGFTIVILANLLLRSLARR